MSKSSEHAATIEQAAREAADDRRSNAANCPPAVQASLARYIRQGTPTGGFLRAVLEDKLADALFAADHNNLRHLGDIVAWVYNEVPSVAWRSREAVSKWITTGGLAGCSPEALADWNAMHPEL